METTVQALISARDTQRLTGRLRRLENLLVRDATAQELEAGMEEARADMIATYLTGGTTETRLKPISGNLISSIKVRVFRLYDRITVQLFQDQRYRARVYDPVHERGKVIVPRRRQYLTIPLNAEAREKSAPMFRQLFVFTSRRGRKLLAFRIGEMLWPMYVLVRRVVIPARPHWAPIRRKWLPILLQRLRARVARIVHG